MKTFPKRVFYKNHIETSTSWLHEDINGNIAKGESKGKHWKRGQENRTKDKSTGNKTNKKLLEHNNKNNN